MVLAARSFNVSSEDLADEEQALGAWFCRPTRARDYMGISDRDYIVIIEKEMESTIQGWGFWV